MAKPGTITPTEFLQVLSRYKSYIFSPSQVKRQATEPRVASESPGRPALESLQELDTWRVNTLPSTIAARAQEGRAYLSHDELVQLMKCKMKRGKFRPQLLPQVISNNPSIVEKITGEAFEYNKGCNVEQKPDLDNLKLALNHLSKNLKGVGIATASYLIAAQIPHWVPAFSDEGFRWIFLNKQLSGVIEGTAAAPDQWTRPIKYLPKEYFAYVEEVWNLRERLISQYNRDNKGSRSGKSAAELFGAGDIEMVGWVLGKEAAGWKPVTPKSGGNDVKAVSGPKDDDEGERHERRRGKRTHSRDSGKQHGEELEVDHQDDEIGEHSPKSKPRKSKKQRTGDAASIQTEADDGKGLRRSTRKRKAN